MNRIESGYAVGVCCMPTNAEPEDKKLHIVFCVVFHTVLCLLSALQLTSAGSGTHDRPNT